MDLVMEGDELTDRRGRTFRVDTVDLAGRDNVTTDMVLESLAEVISEDIDIQVNIPVAPALDCGPVGFGNIVCRRIR